MQIACTLTWPQDFLHIIHVFQEELKKERVWVCSNGSGD